MRAFEQASIVGDLLAKAPSRLLSVKWYKEDTFADLGNLFKATHVALTFEYQDFDEPY